MNFNVTGGGGFAEVIMAFSFVVAVLWIYVHIRFAIAVYEDAARHEAGTLLVSSGMWTLATLLGGIFVAVVYWAMHHSILRRRTRAQSIPVREIAPCEEEA